MRKTIYIPTTLKARMDGHEAENEVNWSAIACQAFERFLFEKSRESPDSNAPAPGCVYFDASGMRC